VNVSPDGMEHSGAGGAAASPSQHATMARGTFVAVAGPSGAGKDSLISLASACLSTDPRVVFTRRVVTRPAGSFEDHDSLSASEFRFRAAHGDFALWWEANGLLYGLPAAILDDLAAERVVVANISRDVIPLARQRFARTLVVHVTASAEVLAGRLAARAREDGADQAERLSRSILREQMVEADVRIENNATLNDAADRFLHVLTALLSRSI
jgi:ribose 1,5-bisphosphokinase